MELQNFMNDHLSSLPSKKFLGDLNLYQFNGFWFYLPYLLGTRKVLSDFKPLSSDVILASFPKTGTTWLKSLLFSIIYRSSKESLRVKNPHDLIPTLETQLYLPHVAIPDFASTTSSSSETGSRIFSTHLPYQIFAETLNSSACKIVYVSRKPKDTLISFWHFLNRTKKFREQACPLELAVDHFSNGTVPFGPYYNHVLGYRNVSLEKPQKVFFITYEGLKDDPKTQVKRLAEFLGCPFQGNDEGEKELEDIVRNCSFETLSNLEVNKSDDLLRNFMLPYNSFFRKGQVGDHLNFLKPEMIERIDAITKEKFLSLGFSYGI